MSEESNVQVVRTEMVPWNRMGRSIPSMQTAEEAIKSCHLDWDVAKVPMMHNGKQFPGHFFVERQDTKDAIGICGKGHTLWNNREIFNFMDDVTMDPGGPKYVEGGEWKGGQEVWMLAQLPDVSEIVPGDKVDHYLLLTRGFYYTSIKIMWIANRICCGNALARTLATFNSEEHKFSFAHKGKLAGHVLKAQDALGLIRTQINNFDLLGKQMADYEPEAEEVHNVLQALFNPSNVQPDGRGYGRIIEQIKTVETLSTTGMGADMVSGTAWGWFNAVTEYLDHHRMPELMTRYKGDVDEYRFSSILYGSIAEQKQKAVNLFTEMVQSAN